MPQLIIVTGTGRSGTLSLAHLLSSCRKTFVTHEKEPHLPWKPEKYKDHFLDRLDNWRNDQNHDFLGDSASYYLPYLDPLPDDLKVLVMERDKEEVVESFDAISGKLNNWQTQGPHNPTWSPCFPNFDQAKNKREALGRYWDFYMKEAKELKKKFPDKVLRFPLENLNSKEGQAQIFDFFGFPEAYRNFIVPCNFHSRPVEMFNREPVELSNQSIEPSYSSEAELIDFYNNNEYRFFRKFFDVKDFCEKANIDLNQSKEILDLGCGDGSLGFLINRYWNQSVDGVDFAKNRLAIAANNEGDYFLEDIYKFLENSEKGYDLIFAVELFEHLEEPKRALEGTKNLLMNNGVIAGTVPQNMPWKTHLQIFESRDDVEEILSPDLIKEYRDKWLVKWNK